MSDIEARLAEAYLEGHAQDMSQAGEPSEPTLATITFPYLEAPKVDKALQGLLRSEPQILRSSSIGLHDHMSCFGFGAIEMTKQSTYDWGVEELDKLTKEYEAKWTATWKDINARSATQRETQIAVNVR